MVTCGARSVRQVPQSVVLKEQFWAFLQTVTVDAADSSESLGYVQASPFAWDSEQVWYDKDGRALAFSRHKWKQTSTIFFRDTVHVEDCNKRDMGEIADDLQSSGLSEVNMLTISAPGGRVVATSTSQDSDTVVNVIDAETGKKMASVRRTKGWGPTDSWELIMKPEAAASGNVGADPRMLVLALAAESASVAWGFGAAGFLAMMAFFIGICVCLCIYMMRNADPKDPRFGILAVFDRPGDHYEEIPAGIPAGGMAGVGVEGGARNPGRFSDARPPAAEVVCLRLCVRCVLRSVPCGGGSEGAREQGSERQRVREGGREGGRERERE